MKNTETTFLKDIKVIDIIVLLLFIFSVKFSFLPLNTNRIVILVLLTTLLVFCKERPKIVYHPIIPKAYLLFFVYLVYTTVVTIFSGGTNLSNLLNIILIVFQISFGSYLVVNYFIKRSVDYFLFCLLLIFAIQGVLIFFNFIIPPYRELLFKLMPPSGNITEDNFTSAFRTRGFMQSSGATVASYLAVGFIIIAYFLSSFKLSKQDKIAVLISIPCVFISILFTGRTGFVMIPYAFVLYYLLLLINSKLTFKSLLPIFYLPLFAVLAYVIGKAAFLYFNPDGQVLISLWEDWAFDQFLNNFGQGSKDRESQSTIEKLGSYFFIPEDDSHFLWGDPLSWGVIRTDLGYIRMLYSVGIVGSAIFYGAFIYLYYVIYKMTKTFPLRIVILFLFIWIAIVEYKEPMFAHYYFSTTSFLLFYFTLINHESQKQVVEQSRV